MKQREVDSETFVARIGLSCKGHSVVILVDHTDVASGVPIVWVPWTQFVLRSRLVPFQSDFIGYIYWSLLRASWVENRQSMTDFASLRALSSAATSRRSSASSLIRRSRHALLKTLNSISAIPSASSGQDSASCRAWECNETRGVGRCAELRTAQMLRRARRACGC